jgi:hypothetical protein
MSVAASEVIRRAGELLQDATYTRWTVSELVRSLNDGQREISLLRPDLLAEETTLALVAGARQAIPADASKLLNILANSGGKKKAVSLISRDVLDRFNPAWRGMSGVTEIQHFMFDARDQDAFEVYPPVATAGTSVLAVLSMLPVDIDEPGGNTYADVAGAISVQDIFASALLDYVLYRAFSKDAQHASNLQRAVAHYAAFANAIGAEIKSAITTGPSANSRLNPKHPATPTTF